MKIAIYQFPTKWMDHLANLKEIENVCQNISGKADLLILPEMFNTGYTMQPQEIPDYWQTETIYKLTEFASSYNLVISGSIPCKKGNKWYNTFIFISDKGIIHTYDKIHLFSPAGENDSYTSGNEFNYLVLNDWKILPLICYDLRFPYLTFGFENPDLIVFSANWPETRIDHWKTLLKARAIENQCYVIGVNRTGLDPNGYKYPGASIIYNYNGDLLTEMGNNVDVSTISLSLENIIHYRKKLPFLGDRKSNFICKAE